MRQLCLFLLVALPILIDAAVKVLPMRRRPTAMERMLKDGTWAAHVKMRREELAASNSTVPEIDYRDLSYLIDITVGTPGQTFSVVADTGSSDLWLPDNTCSSGQCTYSCFSSCQQQVQNDVGTCANKVKFNPSRSSTYAKSSPVQSYCALYGRGGCSGFVARDTVNVGGLTATNTTFGEAQVIESAFDQQDMNGIMGLAWPQLASPGIVPVVNTMINQGALDQSIFSVWMQRLYHTNDDTGDIGGELVLGGTNPARYTGPIQWIPVNQSPGASGYWEFSMDSAGVTSSTQYPGGWNVVSDTGTSFIYGPTSVIQGIANSLGASYDGTQGFYTVDCCKVANLQSIQLKIGGQVYIISPYDYVFQFSTVGGGYLCILGLQGADPGTLPGDVKWILGDVFIRGYYTVHDFGNKRLGMAKAVHNTVGPTTNPFVCSSATPTVLPIENVECSCRSDSSINDQTRQEIHQALSGPFDVGVTCMHGATTCNTSSLSISAGNVPGCMTMIANGLTFRDCIGNPAVYEHQCVSAGGGSVCFCDNKDLCNDLTSPNSSTVTPIVMPTDPYWITTTPPMAENIECTCRSDPSVTDNIRQAMHDELGLVMDVGATCMNGSTTCNTASIKIRAGFVPGCLTIHSILSGGTYRDCVGYPDGLETLNCTAVADGDACFCNQKDLCNDLTSPTRPASLTTPPSPTHSSTAKLLMTSTLAIGSAIGVFMMQVVLLTVR